MTNIVIIGGGPVGLTLAIRFINISSYRNKEVLNINIDIYEKRNKYTREQYIVSGGTKGNLLHNYPHKLRKILIDNFSCNIENPVSDMFGVCFEEKQDIYNANFSQTIEIKKLEKILSDYIKKEYKNKINIIYKDFTKKDLEKYDIIIGADGQKSYVREKLMNVKWVKLKDYESYILHIKYSDLSNKKYRISNNLLPKELKNAYSLKSKKNDYDNYELKSGLDKKQSFDQDRFRLIRSNTNKTQFLLQIDKKTYNKIKNIKIFKNLPLNVKNSVIIDSFIMGSKPTKLENTEINVYNTSIGYSSERAIIKNNKPYFLIGDSSMTTHVFTGEGLNIDFQIVLYDILEYLSLIHI